MPRSELVAYLLAVVVGAALGCGSGGGLSVDAAAGKPGTAGGSAGMSSGASGAAGSVGTGSGGGTAVGDGGSAVRSVAVSGVVGAVPACGPGLAHPNVCCKTGGCIERPDAPFTPCDDGWLTFPARGRCCPLDGTTSCVVVPEVDGGASPAFGACSLPCGPEGHSASGTNFATCGNATGPFDCVYCCSGDLCPSNLCHCPAGGPGSPPCACNTPSCGACPDGWQAPASQVDVCCRSGGAGSTECFSQSVAVSFVAGFSSLTGPMGCDTYRAMAEHVSEISCDSAKSPACTCTVDGVTTTSTSSGCDLSSCGVSP